MSKLNTKKHISVIINALKPLSNPFPKPLLIVMVGLPGTGKTYLARNIQESFPVTIIQSDQVRTLCFGQPKYTRSENKYVFELCHRVINNLLEEGVPVLFDATNMIEANRKVLYQISKLNKAKLFVLKIITQEKIIEGRIRDRSLRQASYDFSKADWAVYRRMQKLDHTINISHTIINNSLNNILCLNPILEDLVAWRNSLYP